MSTISSPLAPEAFPALPGVAGVRLATLAAGLRYRGRADLMLATFAEGTTAAGTFTRSLCSSAPVDWCREILATRSDARAIVCNAGNANAFTGRSGAEAARATAEATAGLLDVDAGQVHLASTGVIGEPLPVEALTSSLPGLVAGLGESDPAAWRAAADAIRTTDTYAKGSAAALSGDAGMVVGIAKGSGMIAPDMATMLAFVFTDLAVRPEVLHRCLGPSVRRSFNRITVDSDTSTSDTVLLYATGARPGAAIESIDDPRAAGFREALDTVTLDLAHQVVRDGEGATKFVEVRVTGAADDTAAHIIASSIANSPLVKTALAAGDPNWGRIVMAVGKAGQAADRDGLAIWIGPEQVAARGEQLEAYREQRAAAHLREDHVRLRADVGVGHGSATVWTCDLTHGYIDINAGYRT